ncbi:PREDICTED: citrate lyase subunit beta-like protein, mitochondrial, partial [Cariama cristata]|uniref:citrate lyase subunit beta-like protein, mitochondrial n=1 Tax=Cariama cristata TaxID=54380 RepID=UPI000520AD2C
VHKPQKHVLGDGKDPTIGAGLWLESPASSTISCAVQTTQKERLKVELGLRSTPVSVLRERDKDRRSSSSSTREARLTVVKTLEEFDFGHTEKCVRINSVSSGLAEEDLEVLLQSQTLPSSMMLPKVENVEEMRWFSDKFLHHLKGRTLVEPMNFIPFVETAVGLLNFKAVCEEALRTGSQVGFHLDAVVFGGEDFRASIGCYLGVYYKCE